VCSFLARASSNTTRKMKKREQLSNLNRREKYPHLLKGKLMLSFKINNKDLDDYLVRSTKIS